MKTEFFQNVTRQMTWQSAAFLLISLVVSLTVNHFRADGLELPGDWSVEAQMTLPSGENLSISLKDAKKLFDENKAVFLDARSYEDYIKGHLKNARSLPWNNFDEYFENVMMDIAEDTHLITYCDGESCHLSKDLAAALKDMGFFNVSVLVNGWSIWQNSQFPTETGS